MKGFPGFPEGKVRSVAVPEPFFTDLLPLIDNLPELKVTLYGLWQLNLREGPYRFLRREDFSADTDFMRGLAASPRQAEEILDDALERAEARGTFLGVRVEDEKSEQRLYFMNTPKGREAVNKLTRGEWRPPAISESASVSALRSNTFTLYEQNIGPLTPMLVEELRDALATYPAAWIEDAIRIAVKNNVRRLKYILAVLERMQTEGRYDRADQQTPEDYVKRYEGYRPYLANREPDDVDAGSVGDDDAASIGDADAGK
jgi:DnaD/phage-associated family protein